MLYGIELEKLRTKAIVNHNIITQKDIKETQQQIADLINVDCSVYGKYEREEVIIPLKHLNTICNHYNVSLDYIFGFTNIKIYKKYKKQININTVGKRLKELRSKEKISQKKLGNIADKSYRTISGYENGEYLISTEALYNICDFYKISADYLLGKIDKS